MRRYILGFALIVATLALQWSLAKGRVIYSDVPPNSHIRRSSRESHVPADLEIPRSRRSLSDWSNHQPHDYKSNRIETKLAGSQRRRKKRSFPISFAKKRSFLIHKLIQRQGILHDGASNATAKESSQKAVIKIPFKDEFRVRKNRLFSSHTRRDNKSKNNKLTETNDNMTVDAIVNTLIDVNKTLLNTTFSGDTNTSTSRPSYGASRADEQTNSTRMRTGQTRKRRYDYEDTYDWDSDGDSLDYEVKEKTELEKMALNWQKVALRMIFTVSAIITFGCCCVCFYRKCVGIACGACCSICRNCFDKLTCTDPNYRRVRMMASQLGIKLDYEMYKKLKKGYIDCAEAQGIKVPK